MVPEPNLSFSLTEFKNDRFTDIQTLVRARAKRPFPGQRSEMNTPAIKRNSFHYIFPTIFVFRYVCPPSPPCPSACVRTRFFAFSRNFFKVGIAENENSSINSLRRTTFVFRYVSDFFGYVVARRVRGPDGPTRRARNRFPDNGAK